MCRRFHAVSIWIMFGFISALSAYPASALILTPITDFTKDNNIYTNLNQQFPNTGAGVPGSETGVANATFLYDPSTYTSPNAVAGSDLANNGVTFLLTSDAGGHDFFDNFSSINPLVVPVNVSDVTSVYTLMGAYFGTSVNVTFTGSGGATETFTGISLPDFNGGGITNTASMQNGSPTNNLLDQTVFDVNDVGAGGTGNSATGSNNRYDLVEQTYDLSSAFAGQTLTSMSITSNGSTPLLLGITAASAAPEPGALGMFAAGGAALLLIRRRTGRRGSAGRSARN